MNVFITGISKGLGHSLANHYASIGCQVFGISRSSPVKLHSSVKHAFIDVASDEVGTRIEEFLSGVDRIDLLINNAGTGSRGSELPAVNPSEVLRQIQVHCLGPLRVTQALLPRLLAAGSPKVINITSRLGSILQNARGDFRGAGFSYAYRIAKAAQNMLSLCMAGDPALAGVIVASVNPGRLKTDSGAYDAVYTADEASLRIVTLIDETAACGVFHAFGEEASY